MDEICYVEPIYKNATTDEVRKADIAVLAIGGMGCQNCVTRVRNSLLSLDGVYFVDIYLNLAIAEVSFDGQKVSVKLLIEAVSRAGNDGRHEYNAELVAA